MADETIEINRQDTYSRNIILKDSNNNFIDATGWIIYFTVRTSVPDTSVTDDTGAVIAKQITGSSTGIHTLTLTDTDTDIAPATYLYDFQIKNASDEIESTETSDFIISGDITRST